eukprot:CAMPEP_0118925294 /NCGR_PEP_ID=MMETSP1169-20130426/3201_1 /TAXON_ID=36882 /ORGANISM="Pyramimonas obovata, Strain CCMP722" /LENGTH=275 /DNA_ID=CAMNT_0006866545 /DNA_START=169 /DNA_END=993 /DNA_ORIENTATION=-
MTTVIPAGLSKPSPRVTLGRVGRRSIPVTPRYRADGQFQAQSTQGRVICLRTQFRGGVRGQLTGRAVPSKATVRGVHTVFAKSGEVEITKLPAKTREGVISAVEELGNRVTVGDVAGKAGLKVSEAEAGLRALASDTLASLQVSDQGDVVYVFPDNPRAAVSAKSLRLRYEPLLKKTKQALGWLTRVLFGTTLVASLVIVFTAIQVVLAYASSSSNNRDERSSNSVSVGWGPRFFPTDLFWYWDPMYDQRQRERRRREGGMNFFEAVFSFVFGDG